ncbi:hypothetical protein HWV62_10809 [Athelia sp. TMB]|nr:hypothetical protein HWV62_10809 [Athelia sp. TMB]
MKQCVRVTGFGGAEFDRAVEGAAKLAVFMQENIDPNLVDQWTPEHFQSWSALEFTNRYFVHQNVEGDMVPVEFGPHVDTEGLLAKIAGENWVHTEENVVSYFRRVVNADGTTQYPTCNPVTFKQGDVVEVQFSVLAFKRRGNDTQNRAQRHSVKLVLRALTLLDDKHTKFGINVLPKDAQKKRQLVTSTIPEAPRTPSRGLKRYVGYDADSIYDDSQIATKKMRELSVQDEAEHAGLMNGSNLDVLEYILEIAGCDVSTRYIERYTQFERLARVCRLWRRMILLHGKILEKLVLDMKPVTPYRYSHRHKQQSMTPPLDEQDAITIDVDTEDDPKRTIEERWRAVSEERNRAHPTFSMILPSWSPVDRRSREVDLIVKVGITDTAAASFTLSVIAKRVQKLTIESEDGPDVCVQWLVRHKYIIFPRLRTIIIAPTPSNEPLRLSGMIHYGDIVPGSNMLSALYIQGRRYIPLYYSKMRNLSIVIIRDCVIQSTEDIESFKIAFNGSGIEYLDLTFKRFESSGKMFAEGHETIEMYRLKNLVTTHIPARFALLFLDALKASSLHRFKCSLTFRQPYTEIYDKASDPDQPLLPPAISGGSVTMNAIVTFDLTFCRVGSWTPSCISNEPSEKVNSVVLTLADWLPMVRELQWMTGLRHMQSLIIANSNIWRYLEDLWVWDLVDAWGDSHSWTPPLVPGQEADEDEIIGPAGNGWWWPGGQRRVPTHIESIMRIRRKQGHPLDRIFTLQSMWRGEMPGLVAHKLHASMVVCRIPSFIHRGIPSDHSDRMDGCYWPCEEWFGCSTHWGYENNEWVEVTERF